MFCSAENNMINTNYAKRMNCHGDNAETIENFATTNLSRYFQKLLR